MYHGFNVGDMCYVRWNYLLASHWPVGLLGIGETLQELTGTGNVENKIYTD
jgi:hypothetical protein